MLGPAREVIRMSINRTRGVEKPPRVVFADGYEDTVLKAVDLIVSEGFATPVLLGPRFMVERRAQELGLQLDDIEIINPLEQEADCERYADAYWERKQKQGVTRQLARKMLNQRNYFAASMVAHGEADVYVEGFAGQYFQSLKIAEDVLGLRPDVARPVGVSAVVFKNRLFLFADTACTIDPSAEELVNVARFAVEPAPLFDMTPRVAFLSFSNYGASDHPEAEKIRRAVSLMDEAGFDFEYCGEMTVDIALDGEARQEFYPFSDLERDANVLIFPNLAASNIATALLETVGGAEVLGPVHRGFRHPVVLLTPNMSSTDIHNLVAMATGQEAVLGEVRSLAEARTA